MSETRKPGATGAGLAAAALWCALAVAAPAHGHGFGQRYDLPIPLWLYLTGAGLTVAVSFLLIALLVRATRALHRVPSIDLMHRGIGRALVSPAALLACRILGAGLYLLVVCAGLVGTQSPLKNMAPALIWAIWWVGTSYASALLGNVWAAFNPLDALFAWLESLHSKLRPGKKLGLGLRYPEALGVWPAVMLFLVFSWMEIVWEGSDTPASLVVAILSYSALTWTGMLLFGRLEWLHRGEVFSLVFGILARFAPTDVRIAERRCNLRPFAVGLLSREPLEASKVVLVVLMLAAVSFDGFLETPAWAAISAAGGESSFALTRTFGLVAAPLLFLSIYLCFCRLIAWCGGASPAGGAPGAHSPAARVAGLFALTLVPIAIAYYLAHYLSFLAMAMQYMIPLASDPFGFGWDLFGTRNYFVRIGFVDARMVWYVSVAAIIAGHMAAVFLAHLLALQEFPGRRASLRSQYPMLLLMVCYTMASLWIISQPIVASRFG